MKITFCYNGVEYTGNIEVAGSVYHVIDTQPHLSLSSISFFREPDGSFLYQDDEHNIGIGPVIAKSIEEVTLEHDAIRQSTLN